MKLSFFNYAGCVNPSLQVTSLKRNLGHYFKHNNEDQISAIYSATSLPLSNFFELLSLLLEIEVNSSQLVEKRCYPQVTLYIFNLSDSLPRITISIKHTPQTDPFNLLDYLRLVSSYYQSEGQRIVSQACYSSCFDAYMTASHLPGNSSYWVSPTSALQDSFEIRAKTISDSPLNLETPDSMHLYQLALPPEKIDALSNLFTKIDNTLPPNTTGHESLRTLSAKLIDILQANQFGDLKYIFNQYVKCLTLHKSDIKLRRKPTPHNPKPNSLLKRLRSRKKTLVSSEVPQPSSLNITLSYLHKQIETLGLSHQLMPPAK